jgi:hypothetical protein
MYRQQLSRQGQPRFPRASLQRITSMGVYHEGLTNTGSFYSSSSLPNSVPISDRATSQASQSSSSSSRQLSREPSRRFDPTGHASRTSSRSSSRYQSQPASRGSSIGASRQRAARNSVNPPTLENAHPTQLRYYEPPTQAVINWAKVRFYLWAAVNGAYPTTLTSAQNEARELLQRSRLEVKALPGPPQHIGKRVSSSELSPLISSCCNRGY